MILEILFGSCCIVQTWYNIYLRSDIITLANNDKILNSKFRDVEEKDTDRFLYIDRKVKQIEKMK